MKAEEQKILVQTEKPGHEKPAHGHPHGHPHHKGHGGGNRTLILVGVVALLLLGLFWAWRWMSVWSADYSGSQLVTLSLMNDGTDIKALSGLVDANTLKELPSFNAPTLRRERLMLQQLEKFATTNPRSIEGRMARLRLARLAHFLGERDSTSDVKDVRASARADLEMARDQYKKLAAEFTDIPTLQQEAMLNQARAMETLGQTKDARDLYESLSKKPDATAPAVAEAKKQFERLSKGAGLETADFLHKETLGIK